MMLLQGMHICVVTNTTLIFVSHDLPLGNYFERKVDLSSLSSTGFEMSLRKILLSVVWNSLLSRKKTVVLTLLSLCVSTMVLIGVEHIQLRAKESFNRIISSVDLIVGAPSGQLNMLLYSIFRMGSPTNNIKYESFLMLQQHEVVEWAIPISLGDSHRGFRVPYFDLYINSDGNQWIKSNASDVRRVVGFRVWFVSKSQFIIV
jgi:hypothetical protein